MLDRLINLGLAIAISSLIGVIAYNLFWPQAGMDVSQQTPSEKIQDNLAKADEYLMMNQLSSAESAITDAMKLAKKGSGPEGVEAGKVLVKRAELLYKQGQKDKAIEDYQHSLTILEKTSGMEWEAALPAYVKLADIYFKTDEYDKAEECLNRGLKAAEKASDESAQARFWKSLSLVKEKQGLDEEAADFAKRAARISGEQN